MFILSPQLAIDLRQHVAAAAGLAARAAATAAQVQPADGPAEPTLEASEIQGNILPGFTMKHELLVGLRFVPDRLAAARAWLAGLLPNISTMETMAGYRGFRRVARRTRAEGDRLPAVALNLALSMPALRLLTTDADEIHDGAFKGGLYGAVARLGDPPAGQPGNVSGWKVGASAATVPHVLLIFAADDLDVLRELWRRTSAPLRRSDSPFAQPVYEEEGHVLPGQVEHFGFRDGISQPGVRGRLPTGDFVTLRQIDPADPRALEYAAPGKALVWPGQFIFGYPSQLPTRPLTPGPVLAAGPDWMRNGSFLVFRRLQQDVAAFRDFFVSQAQSLAGLPELSPMSPAQRAEWLSSRIVGRWPSGEPVMRTPGADPRTPAPDLLAMNHFGFFDDTSNVSVVDPTGAGRQIPGCAGDILGQVCPSLAHIRKVNPRDVPTDKGTAEETRSFQMLRRGIPFGPLYKEHPGAERGLLFLAYQTLIARQLNAVFGQFELLVSDWMNQPGAPQQGGFDLLVGQNGGQPRAGQLNLKQSGAQSISVARPWVVPSGGGYFFSPSLSALRAFLL